jgi:hypothetical protein
MARIAQLVLCVSTARSTADVPQLRGRQPASRVEDCDVCSQDGYTGYNHKDSGSPQRQRRVSVGGHNGQWSLCAAECSRDPSCQGWTYVYNGSPGASSFECYLKPNLDSPDPAQWADQSNDISGLRMAELQLQGQTTDPCAQCFEADFKQYNMPGVRSYGVKGECDGQGLIFSWLDGDLRKMVLTDLQGNVQETGYVNRGFGPYMITSTWTERPPSRGYTITNFRTCGGKGIGEPCGHSYECKHGLVCAIFAEEEVACSLTPGPYGTTEDSHD